MLFAADPPSSGGSSFLTILPIILIVVVMYFLMIRPQNKKRREAMAMQSKIGPGDQVQTVGGLYATVTGMDDESVTLEAAPGVELRYARGAIARVTNSVATDEADADEADAAEPASETDAATSIEKA